MYICIYVYMYICIYVYMYICIYVYMYICIYVYMYICIYVYMYICVYVYMYICIYVYMYICIYVYVDMYICTHVCVLPHVYIINDIPSTLTRLTPPLACGTLWRHPPLPQRKDECERVLCKELHSPRFLLNHVLICLMAGNRGLLHGSRQAPKWTWESVISGALILQVSQNRLGRPALQRSSQKCWACSWYRRASKFHRNSMRQIDSSLNLGRKTICSIDFGQWWIQMDTDSQEKRIFFNRCDGLMGKGHCFCRNLGQCLGTAALDAWLWICSASCRKRCRSSWRLANWQSSFKFSNAYGKTWNCIISIISIYNYIFEWTLTKVKNDILTVRPDMFVDQSLRRGEPLLRRRPVNLVGALHKLWPSKPTELQLNRHGEFQGVLSFVISGVCMKFAKT